MAAVAVTEEGQYVGRFDWDKGSRWSDKNVHTGNGSGGPGRGQAVMLTSGGRWVLEHWTEWRGELNRYEWIDAERAQEWLLVNEFSTAVAAHFREAAEEDRRAGRPEIGGAVHVRLGEKNLADIDRWAAEDGVSRAEWVRRAIEAETKRRAARPNGGPA